MPATLFVMDKNSTFSAGRAVASVIITRYAGGLTLLFSTISLVAIIIVALLTALFSEWWAILLIFVTPVFILSGLLYVLVRLVSSRVAPRKLSKKEKSQTKEFVDEIQNTYVTAKAIKSSPTSLGLAATFAYLTGGRNKTVRSVMSPIESTKSLKEKFDALVNTFSK